MKRNAFIVATAIAMLLLVNTKPSQSLTPASTCNQFVFEQNNFLLEYEWFNDSEFTDPTGVTNTVSAELGRLRNLYSSYVFSASPGMGLVPFEYGYSPIYVSQTIYSNYY